MAPRTNNRNQTVSQLKQPTCDCCPDSHESRKMQRRDFLTAAGGAVLGASALGGVLPVARVLAQVNPTGLAIKSAVENQAKSPESLVKVLYETLTPKQREDICFAWDYQDPTRGL